MRAILVVAPLLLGACHVGGSAAKFAPAVRPAGIAAEVDRTVGSPPIRGELLAIDSSGMHLLEGSDSTPHRLLRVGYGRVQGGRFAQYNFAITNRKAPDPKTMAELRPLARFPQGVDEGLVSKLLAAYGLAGVEEVR